MDSLELEVVQDPIRVCKGKFKGLEGFIDASEGKRMRKKVAVILLFGKDYCYLKTNLMRSSVRVHDPSKKKETLVEHLLHENPKIEDLAVDLVIELAKLNVSPSIDVITFIYEKWLKLYERNATQAEACKKNRRIPLLPQFQAEDYASLSDYE